MQDNGTATLLIVVVLLAAVCFFAAIILIARNRTRREMEAMEDYILPTDTDLLNERLRSASPLHDHQQRVIDLEVERARTRLNAPKMSAHDVGAHMAHSFGRPPVTPPLRTRPKANPHRGRAEQFQGDQGGIVDDGDGDSLLDLTLSVIAADSIMDSMSSPAQDMPYSAPEPSYSPEPSTSCYESPSDSSSYSSFDSSSCDTGSCDTGSCGSDD